MNGKECVKSNPNPEKAKELAGLILNCNISDQNEIFDIMRRHLIDARKNYIDGLQSDAKNLAEQISYAEESLKSIIISEIK